MISSSIHLTRVNPAFALRFSLSYPGQLASHGNDKKSLIANWQSLLQKAFNDESLKVSDVTAGSVIVMCTTRRSMVSVVHSLQERKDPILQSLEGFCPWQDNPRTIHWFPPAALPHVEAMLSRQAGPPPMLLSPPLPASLPSPPEGLSDRNADPDRTEGDTETSPIGIFSEGREVSLEEALANYHASITPPPDHSHIRKAFEDYLQVAYPAALEEFRQLPRWAESDWIIAAGVFRRKLNCAPWENSTKSA